MRTTDLNDSILSELRVSSSRQLLLGHGVSSDRPYYLPLKDLTQTSVHVIGAAGYGKSYYLRHLIDQLVRHRQAFGVLDPHRELFEYALWRLKRAGVPPERVIPLDPGEDRYAVGFNPLNCGLNDPGEAASMVLEAFLKAWGARSFDEAPRMEGILRGMFRLLIEGDLTLLEGYDFLNVDNGALRKALRERVNDRFLQQDWAEFEKLPRNEKLAVVESSRNRLRRVLQAAPVQMMLAQTRTALDLQAVMDKGGYLLANLGGVSAPETQRLIGALLVNGIFHAAKQRDTRRRRPWFFICDEFGDYATRDFANSLDQLRKFGVHLVLAHQRLRQLEREDADVLSAVMTNAKIKVVFGGLERPEAERMAKELFTGAVDGDQVKHVTRQTKFRPVLDTFVVETESDSYSESDSESSSEAAGNSASQSKTENWEDEYDREPEDFATGVSEGRSTSSGRSNSRSSSSTSGSSRSVVPITRHEEFIEETSRQFRTIEEEWERRIGLVHGLSKRQALVRIYNSKVLDINTPDVTPERIDERVARYQTAALQRSPNVMPAERVVAEIEARRLELAAMSEQAETEGRPFKVETFRE
jgi:hypothetical protein